MTERGLCRCRVPHDNWPAEDGSDLCQMCWEDECSASWWQAMAGGYIPAPLEMEDQSK